MIRQALPLLFLALLAACATQSAESQDRLAVHQASAKLYYESGKLAMAKSQVEKGLEIDPDDYLLGSLKGAILLKESGSSQGQDHRQLDAATAILADLYDRRSPYRHEPFLLLPYALALQKQGRRGLGEALSLEEQAVRSAAPDPLREQAATTRATAIARLGEARNLLGILVERGELLRTSHYHQLLIAQDLREPAPFATAAKAYLDQMAKDQAAVAKEIDRTNVAAYEADQQQRLRELKLEELQVRALIAEHHYGQGEFEAALAMLNRMLELDPTSSVDYYNRGRVLLALGKDDAAKQDFRQFLRTTQLPANSEKTMFAAAQLAR